MKNTMTALAIVTAGIAGLIMGTEWGVTGRPVYIDTRPTCESIVKYEDGTARCTYIMRDGEIESEPLPVQAAPVAGGRVMTADELQPTISARDLNTVKNIR